MAVNAVINQTYELKQSQRMNLLVAGSVTVTLRHALNDLPVIDNNIFTGPNIIDFGPCYVEFTAITGQLTFTISPSDS